MRCGDREVPRQSRDVEHGPVDPGEHLVDLLRVVVRLPMLILPVGVTRRAQDEDTIRVDTVLGTRALSGTTLKNSSVRVAISAYDLDVALLRDSRHCPALITRL
jgi:hypothetical protein